ncbi:MAG: metal ABC transporter permease [Planctomycetota bacterium]
MSDTFLQAFQLFAAPFTTALLLAALLPRLGFWLLLRQQVFLGAAIGQASALGFAVALWCGLGSGILHGLTNDSWLIVFGGLSAMAVAVLSLRALSAARSNLEARSVTVFLLGGSGAMLLMANDPHGLHEVMRLQSSGMLGASATDVVIAGALLLVTFGAQQRFHLRLLLWAMDPTQARAQGMRPINYDVAVGACFGLCVAFATHATGLLFTVGLLVLPVLLMRELCASLRSVIRFAPIVGAIGTLIALFIAQKPSVDWPPGQATVALLAVAVLVVRAVRTMRGPIRG